MTLDEDVNIILKKIGLENGKLRFFEKGVYLDNVTSLLDFVEQKFCSPRGHCSLVGTTLFLPSRWMTTKLETFRTIWETHANNVGKYVNEDRYHAVRILCSSYEALQEDLKTVRNIDLCREFFSWCKRTHFTVRLLVRNYNTLLDGQGINLKDFMIFNRRFIFGSVERPDQEKIQCMAASKPQQKFIRYINATKTLLENSEEIKTVDSLIRTLKNTEPWD